MTSVRNKLRSELEIVKSWQKTECLIDLDKVKPEMDKTFKEGKPRGQKTYFKAIDDLSMFTWKPGYLYCITGNPGSGKTEFLNHLTLLKAKYDKWKWLVYSPESYPVMDMIDTYIHAFIGKSTDPEYSNQMSKKEYDLAFEFVKDHIYPMDFKDMPTIQDIIDVAESTECNGVIIDPFNSLDDEGQNIHDFLKVGLTKLKKFARDNNKAVICIEHPHSANSLDDSGNPREPSEYTLNGGKMWHNKCDVIAVVHRPLVHSDPTDNHVTFRTRKVKNQKLNGFPGYCEMMFDRQMNRYYILGSNANKITGFEGDHKTKQPYIGYDEKIGF